VFEKLTDGFRKSPFLWSGVIAIVMITALTPFTRRVPLPPEVFGQVPSFTMTNHLSEPFGSEQLKGQTWVASFIFTRCKTFCPMITKQLLELQNKIANSGLQLKIVSFTVDPEFDTPETLNRYAQSVEADTAKWTFLTAEHARLKELIESGFKLGMGELVETSDLIDIAHAQKLVLVDAQGRMRGYYDATSTGIDEIFYRAEAVVGESLY
jgi:protein SCO1/2